MKGKTKASSAERDGVKIPNLLWLRGSVASLNAWAGRVSVCAIVFNIYLVVKSIVSAIGDFHVWGLAAVFSVLCITSKHMWNGMRWMRQFE
eukprot:733050-Ditylum_brightwellii.AAC.1